MIDDSVIYRVESEVWNGEDDDVVNLYIPLPLSVVSRSPGGWVKLLTTIIF